MQRGYFVRKFPRTSLRPGYFAPTLLLLFLFAGFFMTTGTELEIAYSAVLCLYILMVLVSSFDRDIRLFFLTFLGIISTHVTYGFYFMRGLLSGGLIK
jgi:hypothetical protein